MQRAIALVILEWPQSMFLKYSILVFLQLIYSCVFGLAGSLKLGRISPTSIMRALHVSDRSTRLAQALAEFGRIDKTLHTLNYINDEDKRRAILVQLNRGESRHSLARNVFHGRRGELRQRYLEGQEEQLGTLGLVVNMIILWNTIYMEAILNQLKQEGHKVLDEDVVRLSPLIHDRINMLGRDTRSLFLNP